MKRKMQKNNLKRQQQQQMHRLTVGTKRFLIKWHQRSGKCSAA